MRTLLILLMFAASLAHAAWSDHEEAGELALDAAGLETLRIEGGAGSLDVIGIPDADRLALDDGPGSITLADVGGDVRVKDGSGSVDVRDVQGRVVRDD